jgi:hypothetical protein
MNSRPNSAIALVPFVSAQPICIGLLQRYATSMPDRPSLGCPVVADPYIVLGVARGASRAEVRAARLALVKALHPDLRSEDQPGARAAAERRLADVNAAYDAVLASWRAAGEAAPVGPETARPDASVQTPSATGTPDASTGRGVADVLAPATFAVGVFRPDAFEALVIAAGDLGDVTDVDEPFSLDVFVEGPPRGFCHLQLFPEAGGTVVAVDSDQVEPSRVCRVLVDALARLGFAAHL